VLRRDRATRGDGHRPVNPILELANAPRPFVLQESVAGRLAQCGRGGQGGVTGRGPTVLSSQSREEVLREGQKIVGAVGAALGPSSEPVEDRIARRLADADSSSVTPMSWDEAQRFIDSDEPNR
jgi:hypothetical protein